MGFHDISAGNCRSARSHRAPRSPLLAATVVCFGLVLMGCEIECFVGLPSSKITTHGVLINQIRSADTFAKPLRSRSQGAVSSRCGWNRGEDDVAMDSKDSIRCPATSILNWREYRARLIKGETPLMMRRASIKSGVWAHQISQLEPGCILIETTPASAGATHPEQPAEEETALERRVIFLAQHTEERGSYGLILNKPTPFTIGDVTEKLGQFNESRIHYGGEGRNVIRAMNAHRELHVLHSCAEVRGSSCVIDGVYVGASLKHASQLVAQRQARRHQFKFFYSNTRWEPGQLDAEIAEGKWIAAACCKELILNSASHWEKPLWRLVLEVMGGRHGLMGREVCDEL